MYSIHTDTIESKMGNKIHYIQLVLSSFESLSTLKGYCFAGTSSSRIHAFTNST